MTKSPSGVDGVSMTGGHFVLSGGERKHRFVRLLLPVRET